MTSAAPFVSSLGGRVIFQKQGKLVQVFTVPNTYLNNFLANSKVSSTPNKTPFGTLFSGDTNSSQVTFDNDEWLLLVKNNPAVIRKAKKHFKSQVQRTEKFFERHYSISARPKRKKRAIDFFQSKFHKEYPQRKQVPFHIISTKGREVWSSMTDEQKQPYMAQAENDKKRFEAEESDWKKNNRQPPDAPKSAYATFVQEQKQNGTLSAKSWKTLSDEVKNKYRILAEQDKKRYDNELREFENWQIHHHENILASF